MRRHCAFLFLISTIAEPSAPSTHRMVPLWCRRNVPKTMCRQHLSEHGEVRALARFILPCIPQAQSQWSIAKNERNRMARTACEIVHLIDDNGCFSASQTQLLSWLRCRATLQHTVNVALNIDSRDTPSMPADRHLSCHNTGHCGVDKRVLNTHDPDRIASASPLSACETRMRRCAAYSVTWRDDR